MPGHRISNEPEIIKIYCSHGDGGERGIGPIIGYHTYLHNAVFYAKCKGWWGSNGHVSEQYTLRLNNKYYLLSQKDPIDLDGIETKQKEEMKHKALSKLSKEEKEVLGL